MPPEPTGGAQRLRLGVHGVGGGVEVDAVAFVDRAVFGDIGEEVALDLVSAPSSQPLGECLYLRHRCLRNPRAARSASALGFMALVAGLRLMQSRSWIARFSAT